MESEQLPSKYGAVGKFAAVSAAVLLVSVGLCGISIQAPREDYVSILGLFSLFGMIVGAGGLIGAIVNFLMTALIGLFEKKDQDGS